MQKPEEAQGSFVEAREGSEEAPRKPEEARGTPLCEVRQKLRIPVCERMAPKIVLSLLVLAIFYNIYQKSLWPLWEGQNQ